MQRALVFAVVFSGSIALACKSSSSDTETNGGSTADTSTTAVTTINLTTDPATSAEPTTSSSTTAALTTGPVTTSSTTGEPGTTTAAGSTGTTADITTGPPLDCVPLSCDGAVYACGDCMDNDGDGKYDGADPECVSPCDDREDAFATGLPGDNMDPCKQDCFFDGNSGGGKGDCAWNLKCDPKSPGGDKCPYDPNFQNCPAMQTDECIIKCQVPNGCDCFGCCSIVYNGMPYDIYIGDADCSLDKIDQCEMCTPNEDCLDPCVPDNCEVCFGQELPPGCDMPKCDNMMPCTVDDMGTSNCPEGSFCQTGCCELIVPG